MNRRALILIANFALLASLSSAAQQATPKNLTGPMKMGRADANTFIGLVSDSSCGPRHKLKDKSAEECTRTCQRAGQSYVLVAAEKTYRLKGATNDVAVLAGQKARVTGTLQGDTINVSSVNAAQ